MYIKPKEYKYPSDFFNVVSQCLYKKCGIYSFWKNKETTLYVGSGRDLSKRVFSSLRERCHRSLFGDTQLEISEKRKVFFRFIITKTVADARVLELCFISKLKPALNKSGKHDLTLDISLPKWSKPIRCWKKQKE